MSLVCMREPSVKANIPWGSPSLLKVSAHLVAVSLTAPCQLGTSSSSFVVCVCVLVVCVCRVQTSLLGVFLSHSPLSFWDKFSEHGWSSQIWLDCGPQAPGILLSHHTPCCSSTWELGTWPWVPLCARTGTVRHIYICNPRTPVRGGQQELALEWPLWPPCTSAVVCRHAKISKWNEYILKPFPTAWVPGSDLLKAALVIGIGGGLGLVYVFLRGCGCDPVVQLNSQVQHVTLTELLTTYWPVLGERMKRVSRDTHLNWNVPEREWPD